MVVLSQGIFGGQVQQSSTIHSRADVVSWDDSCVFVSPFPLKDREVQIKLYVLQQQKWVFNRNIVCAHLPRVCLKVMNSLQLKFFANSPRLWGLCRIMPMLLACAHTVECCFVCVWLGVLHCLYTVSEYPVFQQEHFLSRIHLVLCHNGLFNFDAKNWLSRSKPKLLLSWNLQLFKLLDGHKVWTAEGVAGIEGKCHVQVLLW